MNITQWTLNLIKNNEVFLGWMEDRRFEFADSISNALSHIVEGGTIIIYVEDDYTWLKLYILREINKKNKNRPLIMFIDMNSIFNINNLNSDIDEALFFDMLSMNFSKYMFWYIGKNSEKVKIFRKIDKNMLWLMDSEIKNSFFLRSIDENLDFKLIGMVKVFDKAIDSFLYCEIELD
jgi:hypothetical protein